jgi:O-antigen/teichoic acid export membrane protein
VSPELLEVTSPVGLQEPARSFVATPRLTRRASLNLAQSVLDYSVKLGVRLAVVPILVGGLGRAGFGVWEMLARLMGYLESTDGRPTHALRLVVSNSQAQNDDERKTRWVGSALAVWVCFLPLWVATGALLVWFAPTLTKVEPPLHSTVRIACAVMMGGVLLGGLASLPEAVLRGMNLGYKRMGLQAALSIVGGALVIAALALDTGLIGVAVAGLVLTGLTALCYFVLVRRQVPWFGARRPRRQEVGVLLRMSLWIAVGDGLAKLLVASDVIVLGMVLSPAAVTTYVLTGYAALLAVNLHALAADAVMPGLAGILGARGYARASQLRRELLALTILFVTAAGSSILLWNRSFVHLWVGGENYAGTWTNLLLVLIAVQTALIRCDGYLIDAALQPARRVRVSAAAALITVLLSVLLTYHAGMVGLCLGVLLGRATQSICYPVLVQRSLNNAPELSPGWLVRPLFTMLLLFGLSAWLGQLVLLQHWLVWLAAVLPTAALVFGITLRWGLSAEARAALQARGAEVIRQFAGSRSRSSLG